MSPKLAAPQPPAATQVLAPVPPIARYGLLPPQAVQAVSEVQAVH